MWKLAYLAVAEAAADSLLPFLRPLVDRLQLAVEAIRHYPEVDEDPWKINDSYI